MSIGSALNTLMIEMARAGLSRSGVTLTLTPDDFRRACWLLMPESEEVRSLRVQSPFGDVTIVAQVPRE